MRPPRLPAALNRRRVGLALATTAALAVAGCAPSQRSTRLPTSQPQVAEPGLPADPSQSGARGGPAVVGLLLPLTGSARQLGADFLDAAQLALFDIGDAPIELVPRDTGDSPEGAVAAAHAAIDGGAELLLGPLFGRSTTAVAPVAAARGGVAMLSFSNDASVAAPGVYVLGFRPEEQVERVVGYAARRGLTRFAALAPTDVYGDLAARAWQRAVGEVPGARVVDLERYGAEQSDVSAAVGGLAGVGPPTEGAARAPAAALPFDSLLIADGGPRLRAVASGLASHGIDPVDTRLLGAMLWQDDKALLADPAVRGAWLATWSPGAVDGFSRRFRSAYGRAPLPLAVLAYDATALAALLAKGEGRRFAPEQLTDPQGFAGGSGLFRLRPDGLAEHGLAVVEVGNGITRLVDPAPATFPGGLASR